MKARQKIGVRDVARDAGVSVATVSRVLANAGYPVASDTRQKVLASAEKLGFVPNLIARTFSTSRTDTIGVTIPTLNPYYSKMLEGIEQQATASGFSLLLSIVGTDPERRETAIDQFLGRQLDGIVICSGSQDGALRRTAERIGAPSVVIGQQPERGYPTVTVDNVRASGLATQHLIARGHREIVFLTSDSSWPDFRDRLKGFEETLGGSGLSGEVIDRAFDENDAYAVVRKLCARQARATAILAATDRHALGVLAALADAGKKAPQDMAVVGFDNYHTSGFIRPSLTSVDMPADMMGAAAIEMIVAALAPEPVEMTSRVLEPTLVIRQSS